MNSQRHEMSLTLEVKQIAGNVPAQAMMARFDKQGGSIGRRPDNDWVLPDSERIISGRHALIGYNDGRFFITDLSSNGVFLNHAESPLGRESQAPLQPGDTLTIGEYEIGVSLNEQAPKGNAESNSFVALDDPYARLLDKNAGSVLEQSFSSLEPMQDATASEPIFTLDESVAPNLETETPSNPMPPASGASESDHISDLDTHFSQPKLIPEDWQEEQPEAEPPPAADPMVNSPDSFEVTQRHAAGGRAVKPPDGRLQTATPPTSDESQAAVDADSLLQALAEGLGLSRSLLDEVSLPELLENIGRILRSNVEGAMSVLRARAQMKSEFRMSQTMIRPVENNPLKFSVNTEEALRHIIAPRSNSGYLSPVTAFREANEDTEAHMLAVMVGMQSALKAVLQRFKPENLEQRLHQSALLDKVPLYRQAKSWELFTELYSEISDEVEDDFQQLFGRAFSQAYEAQIRRLDSLKYNENNNLSQDRN
ncbi:MAG: type VI secretion system-associated FHA domain protein TagH [Candidatus Thiodiazotropha sp.]